MNDLSLEALVALHEKARVCADIRDGEIVRMYIEGGNDNE